MKALVYLLITHRFELDHILDACDTFERAASYSGAEGHHQAGKAV
jgi:hypothetical protein